MTPAERALLAAMADILLANWGTNWNERDMAFARLQKARVDLDAEPKQGDYKTVFYAAAESSARNGAQNDMDAEREMTPHRVADALRGTIEHANAVTRERLSGLPVTASLLAVTHNDANITDRN